MVNPTLSSLMEAFALAAGIPPPVWRTVPDHTIATTQTEARTNNSDAERQNSNTWGKPVHGLHSGRRS